MSGEPIVYIVDADPTFRRWLSRVVEELAFAVEAFAGASAFLEAADPQRPGCLLLDLGAPDKTGLDLLERLGRRGYSLAVVMLARQPELCDAVLAVRAGACNFLDKASSNTAIQQAVRDAMDQGAARHKRTIRAARVRHRMHQLVPGQREVLHLLVHGASNSQAAESLGLSVRAVEARRAKLMRKMHARSLAELVRMVVTAELEGFRNAAKEKRKDETAVPDDGHAPGAGRDRRG